MFYFDGDRWRTYPKKIQYTERVTIYDIITEPYEDKKGLKIEDVVLTEEQRTRLEAVKHVTTMSLDSLVEYVMRETPKEKPSKELTDAIKAQEERDAMLELIDVDAAPTDRLERMPGLIQAHETGAYFKKKTVISYKDDLYIVTRPHEVTEGMTPETARGYYRKKPKGGK